MSFRTFSFVSAAALVAAAATAPAQQTKPVGLSVRIGLFWPSSERAKSAGKNWFAFGVEYKLGDLKFSSRSPGFSSSYSISADLFSKGDFRNTPVLVNYIGRKDNLYYTAGAGIGFTRIRETASEVETHTEFAYQIGVGYEFLSQNLPLFAEVKYIGSSDSRLAGFVAFVGVRF
ncbi:MAG TPA: acyloxyacyl hydrolase [Fimbriimonadaceae bacterium]|mgnify:CR=1 FL=1|nr:acyloxyacyl hydrolase [Fimbriimonadaceae bacterium]HRJ95184.1 acyloxyacyl hydrolase [Fimbriimonadaceae bacterium]